MAKKRVAFFLLNLNGGGAERVYLNLASSFLSHGLEVDLVLVQATGRLMAGLPDRLRIFDLQASRAATSIPGLMQYLRRERPDAVIPGPDSANLVAAWANLLAGSRTRILAVNHVNIISNTRNSAKIQEKLYPYLLRVFAFAFFKLVAVSQGNRQALEKMVHFPRRKLCVIYNPIVHPEITRQAAAPLDHSWFAAGQPPVILAVGRLTAQKDYPTLLKAFAILRQRRPARLVILGEGEQREALRSLAETTGIAADVDLAGFDHNPFRFMARCNVLALSSLWEGLPTVLAEALACGAQVVSTDCPSGPAEILDHGKYGRLTPIGDAQALAEAIDEALDHPLPAELLRQRANDFSVDVAVRSYFSVLGMDD
jgi:glycosyltransferase involved in cell wall biosynthesis